MGLFRPVAGQLYFTLHFYVSSFGNNAKLPVHASRTLQKAVISAHKSADFESPRLSIR